MKSKIRLFLAGLLALFLACGASLIYLIHYETTQYAISEAEKQVTDLLLGHRAVHSYVAKMQRPEIYRLKDNGHLYSDYFSPRTMSFTFIARGIKEFLNEERRKAGLPEVYFKLASDNPRNPVNRADERESRLLRRMNAGELAELREITTWNGEPHLYVALPIDPTDKGCLRCHGDPVDAPRELIERYGDSAGFWESGDVIRALISIRVPLSQALTEAHRIHYLLSSVTVAVLLGVYLLIAYFVRRLDLHQRAIEDKNKELETLSRTDFLTGVSNRLDLVEKLGHEIQVAARYGSALSLILLDLDHFKRVNDEYGHASGDQVLTESTRTIREHLRGADLLGRWGGEEFVIVAPNLDLRQAEILAEKLRALIEKRTFPNGIPITASFGVAEWENTLDEQTLVKRADLALYAAKEAGRNRVCSYPRIDQSAQKAALCAAS